MPYTQERGRSFMLDRRFPAPVGRIQRSSGTSDPKTFKGIQAVLSKAYQKGLHELLIEVREGVLTPLRLYAMDLNGELATTTTSLTTRPIEDLQTFLDDGRSDHLSADTKRGYRVCLNLFFRDMSGTKSKTVADIPKELDRLRRKLYSASRPGDAPSKFRTFAQLRAVCQAYFSNTPGFGKNSPLWVAVTNVKKLQARTNTPAALTVQQVKLIAEKLDDDHFRQILWSLCLTGMRRGEYVKRRWTVFDDRIEVKGTKKAASVRIIPKCCDPVDPGTRMKSFEKKLREVRGALVAHPHVFRHTFYTWFIDASKNQSMCDRVALYAGHTEGLSLIRKTYGYQNVFPHLAADAMVLQEWVRAQKTKGINPNATAFFDFVK